MQKTRAVALSKAHRVEAAQAAPLKRTVHASNAQKCQPKKRTQKLRRSGSAKPARNRSNRRGTRTNHAERTPPSRRQYAVCRQPWRSNPQVPEAVAKLARWCAQEQANRVLPSSLR
jgi:hypothetical protein